MALEPENKLTDHKLPPPEQAPKMDPKTDPKHQPDQTAQLQNPDNKPAEVKPDPKNGLKPKPGAKPGPVVGAAAAKNKPEHIAAKKPTVQPPPGAKPIPLGGGAMSYALVSRNGIEGPGVHIKELSLKPNGEVLAQKERVEHEPVEKGPKPRTGHRHDMAAFKSMAPGTHSAVATPQAGPSMASLRPQGGRVRDFSPT